MIQTETESQTDKERICDIKDCHSKATGYIKIEAPQLPLATELNSKNKGYAIKEYALVAMCPHHYREMMSEEGLNKAFDMKDNVYAQTEERQN